MCVPAVGNEVLYDAVPSASVNGLGTAVPSTVSETVPSGAVLPVAGVTLMVKVVAVPIAGVLLEAATAVVVTIGAAAAVTVS